MPSKPQRISARITNELKSRIASVEKATGLSEAQQIEACVLALVEYFEMHGSVTLPLAVVPRPKEKQTAPQPAHFPSTARAPHAETSSLNEPTATHDAAAPTRANTPAQPLVTKARRALRGMAEKEKPKS